MAARGRVSGVGFCGGGLSGPRLRRAAGGARAGRGVAGTLGLIWISDRISGMRVSLVLWTWGPARWFVVGVWVRDLRVRSFIHSLPGRYWDHRRFVPGTDLRVWW